MLLCFSEFNSDSGNTLRIGMSAVQAAHVPTCSNDDVAKLPLGSVYHIRCTRVGFSYPRWIITPLPSVLFCIDAVVILLYVVIFSLVLTFLLPYMELGIRVVLFYDVLQGDVSSNNLHSLTFLVSNVF